MSITGTTNNNDIPEGDESLLNLEIEMQNTIEYLTIERDKSIELLEDELKNNFYVEEYLTNKLKLIIRFNRQIRALEAAILIFRAKFKNK